MKKLEKLQKTVKIGTNNSDSTLDEIRRKIGMGGNGNNHRPTGSMTKIYYETGYGSGMSIDGPYDSPDTSEDASQFGHGIKTMLEAL